jgi:phosphatidylglycerol:prolipoprotein diacylglycerol transferase
MTPLFLELHLLGFDLGLSLFGLFLGLGGGVGAVVLALVARRSRVGGRAALALAFWSVAAGVLAARLGGLVVGGTEHGLPLVLNYAVGVAAAALAAAAYARTRELSPWLALDLLGCGLAAAHAIVSLGCMAVGCNFGRDSAAGAPWALRFDQHTVAWHELASAGAMPLAARLTPPLYPVQPVQAAALALLTLALALYARRPRGGRVLGAYLLGAAAIWAGLGPWRADAWHGMGTATCLAAGGIALTLRAHAYRWLALGRDDPGSDPRRV